MVESKLSTTAITNLTKCLNFPSVTTLSARKFVFNVLRFQTSDLKYSDRQRRTRQGSYTHENSKLSRKKSFPPIIFNYATLSQVLEDVCLKNTTHRLK